uniref:Small ribosomal subunit protein uS14c n=1 Tax=Zygnema circumcarinatum TaxID=35869 RepID=A0A6N0GXB7_ZYGCR|nr:ribosomal protein S14 [Zygnema circumcarinatum]
MAKKSSIERDKKRRALTEKYSSVRNSLKEMIKEASSFQEKWNIQRKLQSLPRNSANNRVRRRCFVTGRPRAIYRDFELSRHVLREMAHACLLPGVTKASW